MATTNIVHSLETWPLVVTKIFGTHHDELAMRDAFATWTQCMQRGPHVLIADMTEGNMGHTAAGRARIAEWIKANDALLRGQRQLAHVLVFDSALVRGVVTAVTWLRPPANPQRTARNMDEGLEIAQVYLKAAGISVTPTLVATARRAALRTPPVKVAAG